MAKATRIGHIDVVIALGTSQSAEVDLGDRVIVAIHTPDVWTAANISFLASDATAGDFSRVDDAAGTELVVTAAADRCIVIAPDATRGLRFIKVRSGTDGVPVNQAADRTLRVAVLDRYEG